MRIYNYPPGPPRIKLHSRPPGPKIRFSHLIVRAHTPSLDFPRPSPLLPSSSLVVSGLPLSPTTALRPYRPIGLLPAYRSFLVSKTAFFALRSKSLCSLSSCLLAHSCPICIPIIPNDNTPIMAFPAAMTRTASVRSASVMGVVRGGGVGRIE